VRAFGNRAGTDVRDPVTDEIERLEADGWIARAEGRDADALARLTAAADLEDATEKHPVTLIPVALAPVIFGETWPESAARRAGLAIAILAVVGGAVVFGRARGFAAVVDEHHAVGESSCEQAVSANQRS